MNVSALAALAGFTARRVYAGKRAHATAILLLVAPAMALVLVLLRPKGTPPLFDHIMFHISLYLTLMLTALVHGVALTSGEIEDGSAPYLLLGACPRWAIALAHVLVPGAILGALTLASIAITYAICLFATGGTAGHGPAAILADGLIAWIALTVYLAFFVFCGYAFRHNVAVSVSALLLWEFLFALLPTKFAAYTVVMNTRVLWLYLVLDGRQDRWFRNVSGYDLPTYGEASMFLSVAAAAFLTLSMVAAMNRSIAGREAT